MVITEADIGKFCRFWDRADSIHYGILVDVVDGKFISNDNNAYIYASTLSLDEFKIIQGLNSQTNYTYTYNGRTVNCLFENNTKPTAITGTITELADNKGNE